MAPDVPRNEYPRPQWVRPDWLCLNGTWQFEFDPGDSGLERGLLDQDLAGTIRVPFCPESPLSGIGDPDFHDAVWYRRAVDIPAEWAEKQLLLHFQAVDYDTTVWVNGREVGRHRGGFTPFSCNLTGAATPGEPATLVVRARDNHREGKAKGKQSHQYGNFGCHYVRTTGIWQTVWLEPVPATLMGRPRITPDVAGSRFAVEVPLHGPERDGTIEGVLSFAGREVARATVAAGADFTPRLDLALAPEDVHLWQPGAPALYDLTLALKGGDGRTLDRAESYAGLRSITVDGRKVRINGRVVFQRLVLDQGYYPEGIMTAPTDAALVEDIELALAAGFNGARLHQKVFEERFLTHADRRGYLVWGEFGDWGGMGNAAAGSAFVAEWLQAVTRDYNHPSLVGWCPLNETHAPPSDAILEHDDRMLAMFLATKAADPTRPVLDTSGYTHRVPETDIYDCHDYCQDGAELAAQHAGLAAGEPFSNDTPHRRSTPYRGQPFFVSEFGGIWWNPAAAQDEDSWGYGQRPASLEEFYARFDALCGALLDHPEMFGYCYTQLTDVYQEQNGIYTFNRETKFDMDRIRAAQVRPAAIEDNA